MIPSYCERPTGDIQKLEADRVIADGEVIRWRGHLLASDWMPGQTEFACCVHGEIDGRRVAFTGENIFGSPADPAQHGHEAVVARNSCTVEEGYGYAARYHAESLSVSFELCRRGGLSIPVDRNPFTQSIEIDDSVAFVGVGAR